MSIVLRRFSDMLVRGNICVGSFIPKHYGTRCSHVTYGGVTHLSSSETIEKRGAVYIGGLREDLGIRGYITALSVLRERHGINLALDVVGDGPLREEILSSAADKGVSLRFHGEQGDPTRFLARAKLALVDSYLTILEAMTLRVPVFSFHDNPLKRDYLFSFPGSGEIAAIRDDPYELAIDLVEFLEAPEILDDKVERGYAFAIEQTWSRVADLYRKLYAGRR
jgi:glycosyltransferase involved in cell wall biosynthesis